MMKKVQQFSQVTRDYEKVGIIMTWRYKKDEVQQNYYDKMETTIKNHLLSPLAIVKHTKRELEEKSLGREWGHPYINSTISDRNTTQNIGLVRMISQARVHPLQVFSKEMKLLSYTCEKS